MPTLEQEEFVRTQIAGLMESRPWAQMGEYRKLEALLKIDWEGFDGEQQAEVMRNVVDGKEAARWMDGVVADQPWWKPELDSMFAAIANPPDFERMMREASKAAPKDKGGIER